METNVEKHLVSNANSITRGYWAGERPGETEECMAQRRLELADAPHFAIVSGYTHWDPWYIRLEAVWDVFVPVALDIRSLITVGGVKRDWHAFGDGQ